MRSTPPGTVWFWTLAIAAASTAASAGPVKELVAPVERPVQEPPSPSGPRLRTLSPEVAGASEAPKTVRLSVRLPKAASAETTRDLKTTTRAPEAEAPTTKEGTKATTVRLTASKPAAAKPPPSKPTDDPNFYGSPVTPSDMAVVDRYLIAQQYGVPLPLAEKLLTDRAFVTKNWGKLRPIVESAHAKVNARKVDGPVIKLPNGGYVFGTKNTDARLTHSEYGLAWLKPNGAPWVINDDGSLDNGEQIDADRVPGFDGGTPGHPGILMPRVTMEPPPSTTEVGRDPMLLRNGKVALFYPGKVGSMVRAIDPTTGKVAWERTLEGSGDPAMGGLSGTHMPDGSLLVRTSTRSYVFDANGELKFDPAIMTDPKVRAKVGASIDPNHYGLPMARKDNAIVENYLFTERYGLSPAEAAKVQAAHGEREWAKVLLTGTIGDKMRGWFGAARLKEIQSLSNNPGELAKGLFDNRMLDINRGNPGGMARAHDVIKLPDGGYVFAAGGLHWVKANGSERQLDDDVDTTELAGPPVLLRDGTVVILHNDGSAVGVNSTTGKVAWEHTLQGSISGTVLLPDGSLAVQTGKMLNGPNWAPRDWAGYYIVGSDGTMKLSPDGVNPKGS